nr:uncharacterized protein LOC108946802 [Nicotiana tomentosiformis]
MKVINQVAILMVAILMVAVFLKWKLIKVGKKGTTASTLRGRAAYVDIACDSELVKLAIGLTNLLADFFLINQCIGFPNQLDCMEANRRKSKRKDGLFTFHLMVRVELKVKQWEF